MYKRSSETLLSDGTTAFVQLPDRDLFSHMYLVWIDPDSPLCPHAEGFSELLDWRTLALFGADFGFERGQVAAEHSRRALRG